MKGDCEHKHGAHVPALGVWVCGQCFAMLGERPVRYRTLPHYGGDGPKGPPQEIAWMAEVRKSVDGLTLADFLRTMAKRYQLRCRDGLTDAYAYSIALDFLRAVGEEFADPALDWSHAGAREMADEDMTYWEQEDAASNG